MKSVTPKEWCFVIGDGVTFHDLASLGMEGIIHLPDETTMPDILVMTGVFSTKTQARKNGWHRGIATFKTATSSKDMEMTELGCPKGWLLPMVVDKAGLEVPKGFTDFRAGKGKATRITILKWFNEDNDRLTTS